MNSLYNLKFRKNEINLHPGEYYCSNEDIVISTILGSCISVALYDSTMKQGGLNHFLLPRTGKYSNIDISEEKSARYGIHAMEVLINELMKLGSKIKSLEAKVFGGAAMFGPDDNEHGVGNINTQFALQFLINEKIPVTASDTGDNVGRKIFFFSKTGRVLMRKIHSESRIMDIKKRDRGLKENILKEQPENKIVLF